MSACCKNIAFCNFRVNSRKATFGLHGPSRPLRIGGNRFNLVLYNSVLVLSPMPAIQSSPCCGRTSSQFAEECQLPHPSPRSGAHCSGTTAVGCVGRGELGPTGG